MPFSLSLSSCWSCHFSRPSDQLSERSHVSLTALQCFEDAEIKRSLIHPVTQWQVHILSCTKQLITLLSNWFWSYCFIYVTKYFYSLHELNCLTSRGLLKSDLWRQKCLLLDSPANWLLSWRGIIHLWISITKGIIYPRTQCVRWSQMLYSELSKSCCQAHKGLKHNYSMTTFKFGGLWDRSGSISWNLNGGLVHIALVQG